jgi:hypothetical protein
VTGDCHAGICGSRRVKLPPATRPWVDSTLTAVPTVIRRMVLGR